VGATPPDLGGEGAGHRFVPQGTGRASLFFERALIEITPRRVFFWPDGRAQHRPIVTILGEEAA